VPTQFKQNRPGTDSSLPDHDGELLASLDDSLTEEDSFAEP
jgi:hypothetical protein